MLDLAGLEESVPTTLPRHLLGKALETDPFELARRGVHREPR